MDGEVTVTRLGAWCDLVHEDERHLRFAVQEFAVLSDGRRVTLHAERGFTTASSAGAWAGVDRADLERDVRNTVLPDEDDGEDHPWEWLASLVHAQGVATTPQHLAAVPYDVELSDRLLRRLDGR